MPVKHLRQADVAERWNVSPRTLERWRCTGQGPQFLKVGGRVVYRIEDIEAFEARQARASAAVKTNPAAHGAGRRT